MTKTVDPSFPRGFYVAYVLLSSRDMNARNKSESVAKTPYDDLRRARHGELRLRDGAGLKFLLEDYFDHADELELVGPSTHRAA